VLQKNSTCGISESLLSCFSPLIILKLNFSKRILQDRKQLFYKKGIGELNPRRGDESSKKGKYYL